MIENVLAVTYTTPLALQFVPGAAWAWRHTWSLGIEEMFYLVWPLAIMLVLRSGRTRMRLVRIALATESFLLAAIIVTDLLDMQGSLLFRAGGLLFGCALAVFLRIHPDLRVHSSAGWAGLGLIADAVVLGTFTHDSGIPVLLTVVGGTAMIAHIVQNQAGALSRTFSVRPLTYLGRINYELYLWHYPLLIILGWAFGSDRGRLGRGPRLDLRRRRDPRLPRATR